MTAPRRLTPQGSSASEIGPYQHALVALMASLDENGQRQFTLLIDRPTIGQFKDGDWIVILSRIQPRKLVAIPDYAQNRMSNVVRLTVQRTVKTDESATSCPLNLSLNEKTLRI